jgi:hypothetical protein
MKIGPFERTIMKIGTFAWVTPAITLGSLSAR